MKRHALLIALVSALGVPAMATTFIAPYVAPAAANALIVRNPGAASTAPALPPGLSVQVLDGSISLTNGGGAQQLSAGQFGFTASFQTAPVVVPTNPGLKFTPPPAFAKSPAAAGSSSAAKTSAVDCEVR